MENEMKQAVIVSMARTPVGRCRGKLAPVAPELLGAAVMKKVCEDIMLEPSDVDDIIFGNLWGHDVAGIGRVSALEAGFPVTVPSIRVERQCSSALDSIALAAMFIQTGNADIIIAGGVESDSRRPYVAMKSEIAYSVSAPVFLKQYKASALNVGDPPMIITAENIAEKYNISREECDAYALNSHKKAARAWDSRLLAENVVPISISTSKQNYMVDVDESFRPDADLEKMSKLSPVIKSDGVVTAGNSSPMSDGAGALVVMSREEAQSRELKIFARICGYAAVGLDPNYMGLGPIFSIRKLIKKMRLAIEDIDLFEINEAFASQVIACIKELCIDECKVNIDGGAIALGHPLGGTGAILTIKILNQLKRLGKRYGIVSFCCGGGQSAAVLFENPDYKT